MSTIRMRSRRFSFLFGAAALIAPGLFPAVPLAAQATGGDHVAAAAAAVEIAYRDVAENTVGLPERQARLADGRLPGPPPTSRVGLARHDPAFLADLGEVLDAAPADRAEVLRCPEGPNSCRLDGATVLFTVGAPQIDGLRAVVLVEMTYRVDAGERRIFHTGHEVVLERVRGEWTFVRFGMRWTS